jgi:hypothetical protein
MFHTKRARRSIKCLLCCCTPQNCFAAQQGEICESADNLLRVVDLHRREVGNWPEQHQLKCLASIRVAHVQAISPNTRNLFSQLAECVCVCVCLECIVVLVIMYSHRSPCSRSGAQVSHHNNVHRMIDVGHQEHVNFARLNEPRQGRHTGVQFLFW